MIEQHTDIVNSDDTDKDKISQLWSVCDHLYKVLDEVQESQKDLLFLVSVCNRMNKKGYSLKVDQMGEQFKLFKATFWKSKGDDVETFSVKSPNLVEAIEKAGMQAGAKEAIEIIRKGYQDLGLELT